MFTNWQGRGRFGGLFKRRPVRGESVLARAMMETLESRQFLSVTVPGGYVKIDTVTVQTTLDANGNVQTATSTHVLESGASYFVKTGSTWTCSWDGRTADATHHQELDNPGNWVTYGNGLTVNGSSNWGGFAADHEYGMTLTGNGQKLSAYLDDQWNGSPAYFDNSGSLTLEVYQQVRLTSLTVKDATGPDNKVTVPGTTGSTLYVAEGNGGSAGITIEGTILPEAGKSKALWKVVDANNAATAQGTFASAGSATLSVSNNNRQWTVQAGVDDSGDGVLQAGEVDHAVTVYVVKADVKSLTYGSYDGEKFFNVLKDDGNPYPSQHWQDNSTVLDRDADDTDDYKAPVAYKRGAAMKVDASFEFVLPAGIQASENLIVKGDGPYSYDFYRKFGTDDPNDRIDSLSVNGNTLYMSNESAAAFPDYVDHFDTFDIDWSISLNNGATWMDVGTTKNQVYVTLETPTTETVYQSAVHYASKYAKGESDRTATANKIRSGIFAERSSGGFFYDPSDGTIEANPLNMYNGAGGEVCADFANLTTLLSQTIGLSAHTTLVWGGVSYNNAITGHDTWVRTATSGISTMAVSDGTSSFDFSYHAVSKVDGTYQDAALGIIGVSATALGAGSTVYGETVRILYKDTGSLITNASFLDFDFYRIP